MFKHILVHTVFQSFVILLLTFMAEDFIPESLKDTDQVVVDRFELGGGYVKAFEGYSDGMHENPFPTMEDLKARLCIITCGDGNIRSGRAFASMGSKYDYAPMYKVRDLLGKG